MQHTFSAIPDAERAGFAAASAAASRHGAPTIVSGQ